MYGYCRSLIVTCATVCAAASFVSAAIVAPPGAPSWWNNHDSPYWSYHDQTNSTSFTEESNNGEFRATLTTVTGPGAHDIHVTLDLENGYSADLYKHFYIWLEGASGNSSAPSFVSLTVPNDPHPNPLPDSVLVPVEGLNIAIDSSTHVWDLSYGGTATPQPDRVVLKFDMPLGSVITHWEAGEQCLPLQSPVPEPSAIAALMLAGLPLYRRRIRH